MATFTFSEQSQIILRDIGWFPERKVDPSLWIDHLHDAGYKVFDAAKDIFEELGGLHSQKVSNSLFTDLFSLSDKSKVHFITHPAIDFLVDDAPGSNSDASPYWKEHSF